MDRRLTFQTETEATGNATHLFRTTKVPHTVVRQNPRCFSVRPAEGYDASEPVLDRFRRARERFDTMLYQLGELAKEGFYINADNPGLDGCYHLERINRDLDRALAPD